MKKQFIIFFTVVLSVYGLINFYIFFRGWNALGSYPAYRTPLLFIGILLAAAYPLGRVLERYSLSRLSEVIVYTGAVWLGEMVYLFLITAAMDIIRLILFFIPVISLHDAGRWDALAAFALATVMTVYGFVNARFPKIKNLRFDMPKRSSSAESMTIAAVSDIHLGTIMGPKRLRYIVDRINSINADIVLFVGDVFDEDIGRVIKNNLGQLLAQIRSKYGMYAVTGNHEYFGGVDAAVNYLHDHGITVLRDESVDVAGAVRIIGREDRSSGGWNNRKRKSIPEIIPAGQNTLPMIVMDHQPQQLQDAVDAQVDLQLSGHTHHGQLWPFNYITKKVYEVSWGYKKKGNTHFYVSCGAGSWGPPIRTGNTPEILRIDIRFH
jgi:hypothetical protein